MGRWRVKASRYQANWFHACEVFFLDAEDAHVAKATVEADPALRVWAVTPATPVMEAGYLRWIQINALAVRQRIETIKRSMQS